MVPYREAEGCDLIVMSPQAPLASTCQILYSAEERHSLEQRACHLPIPSYIDFQGRVAHEEDLLAAGMGKHSPCQGSAAKDVTVVILFQDLRHTPSSSP
jgi:hypothetical protein